MDRNWLKAALVRMACCGAILISYFVLSPQAYLLADEVAASPAFDAGRALTMTQELVTQFPTRLFGTLEARQATGYLTDRLKELGYRVDYIHYDGRIGRGQQAGRNVLAYKQGKTDEILVITASFDTARPTVGGAVKNGAAVGVLLELAAVFAREETRRGLLFAFTDGGEWGSTGANDLALNHTGDGPIVAALSLNHVAPGQLAGFRLGRTGQMKGFTPDWLSQLAEAALQPQNLPVTHNNSLLEKAFLISRTDQGPFLRHGIAAIDLSSYASDEKREKEIIYSPQDTSDNIDVAALEKYGRGAEAIVRMLDAQPAIARLDAAPAWLTGIMIAARNIGLLLPIILGLWYAPKKDSGAWKRIAAGRELVALGLTAIPVLLIWFGVRLAHAARQFPFYDLYPAVSRDPVMQHPPVTVFIIIAASVVFVALITWVSGRYFLKEWSKPDFVSSRLTLLGTLVILWAVAINYNVFWALVFLLPPLALWAWAARLKTTDTGKKIFATVIILLAAVPAKLAFLWLADQLDLSWNNFFWYQALALTTGLFTPLAFILSAITIASGIRLLVITWARHSD